MLTNSTIDELIIKEYHKRISQPEQTELDLWISESDQNMQYYLETKKVYEDAAWDNSITIPVMQFDMSLVSKRKSSYRSVFISLAAVLLLSFSIYLFIALFEDSNKLTILSKNEIQKVILPDGSHITLNANSSIQYDEATFNKRDRQVSLIGEAFFDIEKSTTRFIIDAYSTRIEVLGTSFNVKTSIDSTILQVKTGHVKFSGIDTALFLKKGSVATYVNDSFSIIDNNIALYKIGVWKSNIWSFRKEKLGEIIPFFSHYYNVNIHILEDNINELTITANMSKTSLTKILLNITELHDLKFFVKNQTYYITYKNEAK
jgi:transmembrane sensor